MKGILGFAALLMVGAGLFATPWAALADTVGCGSVNGRRATCDVPWEDARLLRQESRSACIRNRTWGMDRRGIWVDDGCRGIFEEAYRRRDEYVRRDYSHYDDHHHDDHHYERRPARPAFPARYDRGRIVSCESYDNKREFCRWPIGYGARLVEQISRSECREGYSYGFTRDGIWVSRGCRGRFRLVDG